MGSPTSQTLSEETRFKLIYSIAKVGACLGIRPTTWYEKRYENGVDLYKGDPMQAPASKEIINPVFIECCKQAFGYDFSSITFEQFTECDSVDAENAIRLVRVMENYRNQIGRK